MDPTPSLTELDTLIDRLTNTMETAPVGTDRSGWRLHRCWLLAVRHERHRKDPADLALALADFNQLPDEAPGRSRLAAVLVVAQIRTGHMREHATTKQIVALAEVADRDPEPAPGWREARAVVAAMALVHAVNEGEPGCDATSALAELENLAAVVGDMIPYNQMFKVLRHALSHLQTRDSHDFAAMDDLARSWRALFDDESFPPEARSRSDLGAAYMEIYAAAGRGDVAAVSSQLTDLAAAADALPPGDPWRERTKDIVDRTRAKLSLHGRQVDQLGQVDRRQPLNLFLVNAFLKLLPPAMDPDEVEHAFSVLGGNPDVRNMMDNLLGQLQFVSSPTLGDDRGLDAAAVLPPIQRAHPQPASSAAERASRRTERGVTEVGLGMDDVEMLGTGIEQLRLAVAESPTHDVFRPFHLTCLGIALCRRFELDRGEVDLAEATAVLEEAQHLARSPGHAYWAMACQTLGHAYRLAGRWRLGRDSGLRSLRGHVWGVLLQSTTEAATAAARHAAEAATDVARWCLADRDLAGAVAALDAGRGLMIYAATAVRSAPEQLDSIGEHDLADEWRAATGATEAILVSGDLRRRVLQALTGQATGPGEPAPATTASLEARLLDPPTLDEIRAALGTLNIDALVYLVPGDDLSSGAAVIVPASEPPSHLRLLELRRQPGDALERFVTAASHNVRDAGPASEGDAPGDPLGRLCDWAWTGAMNRVLAHFPPRKDRPHRLVLIPMGELGRVPWHAARRARGAGGHRYAVEKAVVSYAVSARMLCDSAWASKASLGGEGLIVGDPDTAGQAADLPDARAEALAIRDAFYRNATYLGRATDGAQAEAGGASRGELLRWLDADPNSPGALLHLACHGLVRSGTGSADTAYLLVGAGERLAAEELITTAASGKVRNLGLAVLAACGSSLSGRGYDEAFSLASAFLAIGTRTVVGSQWSVPSRATSVLMFMFHHNLRARGMAPAEALREAQLWMTRPDRELPPTMPSELRQRVSVSQPYNLTDWAAFIHFGH